MAGGADVIRIAKTESAQDVRTVEEHVLAAEREFGRPEGSMLLMAALESVSYTHLFRRRKAGFKDHGIKSV